MDEKSLYAHILNLSAPWEVESLSLDEKSLFSDRHSRHCSTHTADLSNLRQILLYTRSPTA